MSNEPTGASADVAFWEQFAGMGNQPPAPALEILVDAVDAPPAPAASAGMVSVAVVNGDRAAAPPAEPAAAAPPVTGDINLTPPSAEEMAFGTVGLAPVAETPQPRAKPRKVVRFVQAERETVVPLEHPLECDDVLYDRIVVRRLTVADYVAHFDKPAGERGPFPCFFDVHGEAVPVEVLDALSLDDSGRVTEAYNHFLPSSFRADPVPSSSPNSGEASPLP